LSVLFLESSLAGIQQTVAATAIVCKCNFTGRVYKQLNKDVITRQVEQATDKYRRKQEISKEPITVK
jgi:hypothetical protein